MGHEDSDVDVLRIEFACEESIKYPSDDVRLSLLDVYLSVRPVGVVNSVFVSPCEDCFCDGGGVLLVSEYSDVVEVLVDVDKDPGSSDEDWDEDLSFRSAISGCALVRDGVLSETACW